MDVNEEFAAKLACVRCGRSLRNKAKWFRLTEQESGLNFYYRCAKCHSVFRGVVTKQMLAQLEKLAQLETSTFTGASLSTTPQSVGRPRNQARRKLSQPRFIGNRRAQKEMERYARKFEKELYTEGNDCLVLLVMQEGKNWRSN
jgi:hypothetical protein